MMLSSSLENVCSFSVYTVVIKSFQKSSCGYSEILTWKILSPAIFSFHSVVSVDHIGRCSASLFRP